ncbi:hypothetical protein IAT38_002574 [Cryptococcus sp. DSM 104549]
MAQSRPTSASASSSRIASPAPGLGSQPAIDPYRIISGQVKKPLAPLLPTSEPSLPSLLHLDPAAYSNRLSGKTLLTTPDAPSGSSSLVKGKKRNRGNPVEKAKARDEVQRAENERKALGLVGMRKVKKRLGSVMNSGQKISYTSLIPLHHLHTLYLLSYLTLPPLPSTLPTQPPPLNPEPFLTKISKADFTGIYLTVISARGKSLAPPPPGVPGSSGSSGQGVQGIVIEETAGTFRLVGKDDKVRVVPKKGTLFRLSFPAYSLSTTSPTQADPADEDEDGPAQYPPDLTHHLAHSPRVEIDLLGSTFAYRSFDRAGRKFKQAQENSNGNGWAEDWVGEGTEWGAVFGKLSRELEEGQSGEPEGKGKKARTEGAKGLGEELRQRKEGEGRKRTKWRRKDLPAWSDL